MFKITLPKKNKNRGTMGEKGEGGPCSILKDLIG